MLNQHITPSRRKILVAAAAATLALLVWGDRSSAGIEGTGRYAMVAHGRITAFGSIFVDGVEYDIAQANIHVNGHSARATQLAVGQIVTVQGFVNGAKAGTAHKVTYTGDVVGPVSQVDVTAGTFTVLGQTVAVNANTLFGEGIQPAGIAALQPGTGVQVSAFAQASGELLASRIDLQTAGAPLQVVGAVQALDTGARTFQLNALTIDYSQAKVKGTLANGSNATVWADEYPTAGTLHVTRVEVSSGVGGVAGAKGDLEGLITSVAANGNLYVGDQLVIIDPLTHLLLNGPSLVPDLAVRVEGTFDSSGALVAKSVSAEVQLGAH
jgi:Domain of unknown function (DUF5666)